jgi:Bacteriophage HK97-gp10, putative tail-component
MIRVRATVDASDLDRLLARMQPAQRERTLIRAFSVALRPVVRDAKAIAPVGKTGKLRRSIRVRVRRRLGLEIDIFVGVPYGYVVEYGHRQVIGGRAPRVGRSYRRRGNVFIGAKGGRYAGRVVGFVKPHPYTTIAFAQHAPEVERDVAREIERDLAA